MKGRGLHTDIFRYVQDDNGGGGFTGESAAAAEIVASVFSRPGDRECFFQSGRRKPGPGHHAQAGVVAFPAEGAPGIIGFHFSARFRFIMNRFRAHVLPRCIFPYKCIV